MIKRLAEEEYINRSKSFSKLLSFSVNADNAYEEKNMTNLGINLRGCVEEILNCVFFSYERDKKYSLDERIKLLPELNVFTNVEITLLNNIRKAGNAAVHGDDISLYNFNYLYEKLLEDYEQLIEKMVEFDTSDERPEIATEENRRDLQNFMLYSDTILAVYKKMALKYEILYIFVVGELIIGFFMYVTNIFKADAFGVPPLTITIPFSILFIFLAKYSKKMMKPKYLYEIDQKNNNYRVKEVHKSFLFSRFDGVIDYSINWEQLYRDK